MTNVRWTGVVAVVASIVASPAEAQSDNRIELAPFAGYTVALADGPHRWVIDLDDSEDGFVADDGQLENAVHFGINVAAKFGGNWAIEGMFSWTQSDLSAVNLEETVDVDILRYSFGGRVDSSEWNRLHLFVGLGVGWETFDYALDSADADMHFSASAQGGATVRLIDDLRLRVDARPWLSRINGSEQSSARWENDLMLSAGLSWGHSLD